MMTRTIPAWIAAFAAVLAAIAAGDRPVAVAGTSALPGRLVFAASGDTSVSEARPRRSFADAESLTVDGSPRRISYVRFEVKGTAGQAVLRARLRMLQADAAAMGGVVRGVEGAWNETTTWNTRPALGARWNAFGAVEPGAQYTLGVTAGSVDGDGRVSFAITSGRANGSAWASSESSTPPELILDLAPRIAAAGDIACDPDAASFNDGAGTATMCKQRAVSSLLVNGNFAAVLALGDTQYPDGAPSDYDGSYDPSWGRVRSRTHPSAGNHEYKRADASGYYGYFGDRAHEPGWYSFDLGAWHLIALNSNCGEIGGCGAGSNQMTWLQADLASNDATCTLAYMHHPRFSSGLHGNAPELAPIWSALDGAGVDILLTAHDHDYERFRRQDADGDSDPDGIREFVVGTGGHSLRAFTDVRANSVARSRNSFGVLRLILEPDRYRWRFLPAAGGTYSDAGATACR